MKGTINEKAGWKFSNGSAGKRWIRGRVMISEGKRWISQNEYIPILTHTNLDTGEIVECISAEYKKFLTDESWHDWCYQQFVNSLLTRK